MSFSERRNETAQSFAYFQKKKVQFKMTGALEILELFTLHLLVYLVFSIQRNK